MKIIKDYCYYIGLFIVLVVLYYFYYDMIPVLGIDHRAHLEGAKAVLSPSFKLEDMPFPAMFTYPLYHISVKGLAVLAGGRYRFAASFVLAISNIATVLVTRYILKKAIQSDESGMGRWIDVIALCSILFETIASPLTDWRIYERQCSANPWHNPTITFVRPFGLICFYLFVCMFNDIHSKKDYRKNLIMFGIFSVISTLAKPSYSMVLMPAAGLFTLAYWVRDFKGHLKTAMYILGAALPTIAVVLGQFLFCQFGNNGTVSPVSFTWGSFSGFTTTELLAVSVATVPVPILTFLFASKKELFKTNHMRVAFLMLMVGWLEFSCMTNGDSGDFSWGYMLAIHLTTALCLAYNQKTTHKWKKFLINVVFILQVFCGLIYFARVWYTGEFWF